MALITSLLTQSEHYTLSFKTSKAFSGEACLMLHGFPAANPTKPEYEKNQDIAATIAEATNIDVYLIHYQGLGRSLGQFSFRKSITDSLRLAKKLLTEFNYKTLHIVGHSWGALVAINLMRDLINFNGRLILLSPFNDIPSDDVLRRVLKELCADTKIDFGKTGIEGAVNELRTIANDSNPRTIASTLKTQKNQVTIVQATQDDEVPILSTREFVDLFLQRPAYIEFDSDHKFSINRSQVIDLIVSKLKNIKNCE